MRKNTGKAIIAAILLFSLSACGGGGGGGSSSEAPPSPVVPPNNPAPEPVIVDISGVVQKGKFTQLKVEAFLFDTAKASKGKALTVSVSDQSYSLRAAVGDILLLEASGVFLNDADGTPVTLDQPLRQIFTVTANSRTANINFATSLVAERVLSRMPAPASSFASLLSEQTAFINETLKLPPGTDPTQLDYRKITDTSDVNDPNLILLLTSAALVDSLVKRDFIPADAFVVGDTVVQGAEILPDATAPPDTVTPDNTTVSGNTFVPNDTLLPGDSVVSGDTFLPGDTAGSGSLYQSGMAGITSSIVNASTPTAAGSALSRIDTQNASDLYTRVQNQSGYDFLPAAVFDTGTPVFTCQTAGSCQWTQTNSPTISVTAANVHEAFGRINVKISLSSFPLQPVVVRLSTFEDTAKAGEDYFPLVFKTVTFAAGETVKYVPINVLVDAIDEPTERMGVTIESDSTVYTLLQDRILVDIYNGAPDYVKNQNAGNIAVRSMSIPEQCDALGSCDLYTSLGFRNDAVNRLRAKLDLEVGCIAGEPCPEQSRDWLASFYLVARDAQGVTRSEALIGEYVYPRTAVQSSAEPADVRQPFLAVTGQVVEAVVQDAAANSWTMEVEVRLGGSPDTTSASTSIKPIYLLPSSVMAGDIEVPLDNIVNVTAASSTAACQSGDYFVAADYYLPGLDFYGATPDQSTDLGNIFKPAVSGGLCLSLDASDPLGSPATISDGSITLGSLPVALPDGGYIQYSLVQGSWERSVMALPYLILFNSGTSAYNIEQWLHYENWPVKFKITDVTLSSLGLAFAYSDVRYIMDVDYSTQDSRSNGNIAANNIYFSKVSSQSGNLLYTSTGLKTAFQVGASTSSTLSYPYSFIQWDAFTQNISSSHLEPATLNIPAYVLLQSTSCRSAACDYKQDMMWAVTASSAVLDAGGYLLADAVNQNVSQQVPVFGSRSDGSFSWSRPQDLTAQQNIKLALPGYVVPGQAQRTSDYLIAHLNESDNGGDHQLYPLGTPDFNDGNYHPVGLSLGPEIYRDANGQPQVNDGVDLTAVGGTLSIDNGFDPVFDLVTSPGVKYVIRPSGVTGVFNVKSSELGAKTKFYNYPLTINRFAVRMTDNLLDSYTWIDGILAMKGHLGGPSGFDIWFESLEIDCAANLGKMSLIYEKCGDGADNNNNGGVDENCSPVAYAWNTPIDVYTAGFVSLTEGSCGAVSEPFFQLEHEMDFKALDKPLMVVSYWDKLGMFDSGAVGALPHYRFDRSKDGEGFTLKSSNADLKVGNLGNDYYGWLEMSKAHIAMPFWQALEADMRFANNTAFGDITAEPTVVMQGNTLSSIVGIQDNATVISDITSGNKDLQASYQWGSTGFGFQLPVYYQPYQFASNNGADGTTGKQSRFLGRTVSKDLLVFDVNAGINFIEPDKTRLSFGASADFARLGDMSFQIDITDPDSLRKVDELLISVKVIQQPVLQPALQGFVDSVNVVNKLANTGLDTAIEQGLKLGVKHAGVALSAITPDNKDPFVSVSDSISLLRNMPSQIVSMLIEEISAPIKSSIYSLQLKVGGKMAILNQYRQTSPASVDAFLSAIDDVIIQADTFNNNVGKVTVQINHTVIQARKLLADAKTVSEDVASAVSDIALIVSEVSSFTQTACDTSVAFDPEDTGYLDAAFERIAQSEDLLKQLDDSDELFNMLTSLIEEAEQKSRLREGQKRIKRYANELMTYIKQAEKEVKRIVCDEQKLDETLQKVNTIVSQISKDSLVITSLLGTIGNIFDEATQVITDLDRASVQLTSLSSGLRSIRERARQDVNYNTVVSVNQSLDKLTCQLTKDLNACPDPSSTALTAWVDNIFIGLKTQVDGKIDTIQTKVMAKLDGMLPGAYMTPDELRAFLVKQVMTSGPVKELRLEMDKQFDEINSKLNDLVLEYMDQLNLGVQTALADVAGDINEVLEDANTAVRDIPFKAGKMDGYATIAGNEIERLHVAAEWSMQGAKEEQPTTFKGALDVIRLSVYNEAEQGGYAPTGCAVSDASSLLDVKVRANDIPINIADSDINLSELMFAFTLDTGTASGPPIIPVGIFGHIYTRGEIEFTDFKVIDPNFSAGLGLLQTYIGASADASFSDISASVAFLIGKVCPGNEVLEHFDEDYKKYVPSLPPSGFAGAYVRGGGTIPLIPGGCMLNVGVSADFGTWLLIGKPTTLGGLVGGGALGEVACIAAIRGKATVAGSVNTDGGLKLVGDAWGVGGMGFCDPETWTSVRRSRDDSWCGTGDVQLGATFENGDWEFTPPDPDWLF